MGRTTGEISLHGSPFLQVLSPNTFIHTCKTLLRFERSGLRLTASVKLRGTSRGFMVHDQAHVHRITDPPSCTRLRQMGAQSHWCACLWAFLRVLKLCLHKCWLKQNIVEWTTQTFSIKFCSVLKYVSISPMLKAVASSCHKHSCKKIVLVYIYGKFYAHTYWWLPFWNVFLVRPQTRILMKVAFIHSRSRNNTMWQITIKNAALVASI